MFSNHVTPSGLSLCARSLRHIFRQHFRAYCAAAIRRAKKASGFRSDTFSPIEHSICLYNRRRTNVTINICANNVRAMEVIRNNRTFSRFIRNLNGNVCHRKVTCDRQKTHGAENTQGDEECHCLAETKQKISHCCHSFGEQQQRHIKIDKDTVASGRIDATVSFHFR